MVDDDKPQNPRWQPAPLPGALDPIGDEPTVVGPAPEADALADRPTQPTPIIGADADTWDAEPSWIDAPPPTVAAPPVAETDEEWGDGDWDEDEDDWDEDDGQDWEDATSVGPHAAPAAPSGGRRAVPVVVTLLILVLVAALAVALLALRDSRRDGETAATTTTEAVTTTSAPARGVINLPAGVTAFALDTALTPGATITGELSELPSSLDSVFQPVAPFVDVSVENGRQTGPIELVFPIQPGAKLNVGDGAPVLYALHQHDGVIDVLPGVYNGDARTYRVEVPSFSTVGIVSWRWDRLTEAFSTGFAELDGTAGGGEPSCDAPDAADSVKIDGGGGKVVWCSHRDEDGTRIVRGRNNTRFAVQITWTSPAAATVEDDSVLGAAGSSLSGWRTSTSAVVGPGGEVTVEVPATGGTTITSSFADAAANATWLMADGDAVAALSEVVPGAERVGDGADAVDRLERTRCADVDVTGPERAARIMAACYPVDVLGTWFGADTAVYLSGLADGDILTQLAQTAAAARQQALIDAAKSEVVVDAGAATTWPTADHDAPQSFLDAFIESGFVARWTSCAERMCIGGDATSVVVLEAADDGSISHLGTVDVAEDPAAALSTLGLSSTEIGGLLAPGPPAVAPDAPVTSTTSSVPN